jgi:Kef-type K+ transport system membrane component KefB
LDLHFTNLLVVVAIAFAAPLVLGFAPALRFPAVVLEIVAGIAVGPAVLGWVHVDEPVQVMSIVGLAFLLFLAGLEIEVQKLRGTALRLASAGFAVSFAIALVIGAALGAAGVAKSPLFLAIVLSATSLGVIVPVLKDAHQSGSMFGQLVIAAGSIADFATIILLSLFFSRETTSTTSQVILIAGLFGAAGLVGAALAGVEHSMRLGAILRSLQDTTAQIRVRGAFLLMIGLVALATQLGLEVILGAFLAGAIVSVIDRDRMMTHPQLRLKLDAIGYGVFIPVFFVTTGVKYDLNALGHASTLARVPLFLAALMLARGIPALVYRRAIPQRQLLPAALLQATSLPFIVAATSIGVALHVITSANAAALIAAGLLSVVMFPALALLLLQAVPRPEVTHEVEGGAPQLHA